jgi:hypothetical protein
VIWTELVAKKDNSVHVKNQIPVRACRCFNGPTRALRMKNKLCCSVQSLLDLRDWGLMGLKNEYLLIYTISVLTPMRLRD